MKCSELNLNFSRSVLCTAMILQAFCFSALAQTRTIQGKVSHALTGEILPGVNIIIKGTSQGTITREDGKFTIEVPDGYESLLFSYLGMITVEESIDDREIIDLAMTEDVFGLDEVVVSGIAGETPRKKLPISVEVITEEDIKKAPMFSAASALASKMAGVSIGQSSGEPYTGPRMQIRGLTSITGYQPPMIIVDGMIMEGTLLDINVDDIESIEVLKGAASTSLYGSRAGSGVIVVHTKRGRNLQTGRTEVTFRTEFGRNSLARKLKLNDHHAYELADDWENEARFTKFKGVTYSGHPDSVGWPVSGTRILKPDGISDNPYGVYYDQQELLYPGGDYWTNYISVSGNFTKTNYLASFERSVNQGIMLHKKGYTRNGFRINLDHSLNEKLRFSASNLLLRTETDIEEQGAFLDVLFMTPDVDLNASNLDGTNYRPYPDPWNPDIRNPLYDQYYFDDNNSTNRFMGSYMLVYNPFPSTGFHARYSIETSDYLNRYYFPPGKSLSWSVTSGVVRRRANNSIAHNVQMTADFDKQLGEFNIKTKVSYLYENYHEEYFYVNGEDLSVRDLPTFNAVRGDITANSSIYDIRSENVFAVLDGDYKGKYIISALFRMDGSSLFGENERWNPYHRISAAYRLGEDIKVQAIDELKIRASYGTSGIRPPFEAKDETYVVYGGTITKNIQGNPDLKPATIHEWEVGADITLFDRVNVELVYSDVEARDQIDLIQPNASGGFRYQWVNIGTLHSSNLEATLGVSVLKNSFVQWDISLNGFRTTQLLTDYDAPDWFYGPYRFGDGLDPYTGFGRKFFRDLDEFYDYYEDQVVVGDYQLNSEGYVIRSGTEGTPDERAEVMLDSDGMPVEDAVILNSNADFQIGIVNNLRIKNFHLYFLLDWRQGADIYNSTRQFPFRNRMGFEFDQSGVPQDQKKVSDYYYNFYQANDWNSYYVEDGTYLKIREIALSYSLPQNLLKGFLNGTIQSVKLSVVGKNLHTWTRYSGYDPEVGFSKGLLNAPVDYYGYPIYRTISGMIELKF